MGYAFVVMLQHMAAFFRFHQKTNLYVILQVAMAVEEGEEGMAHDCFRALAEVQVNQWYLEDQGCVQSPSFLSSLVLCI